MTMDLIVVKIGGALIQDALARAALWTGIRTLQETYRVIVVHGGGPQANALSRRLGHEPTLIEGRRVTGQTDLDVLKWTLRGAANSELVGEALGHGIRAVGLCAADGGMVVVAKRPPTAIAGQVVDFGFVGDVQSVHPEVLFALLDAGFTPVVASLSADASGQLYNVNADTISCAIAQATGAKKYLLATETGGVRRDASDPASHLATLDDAIYHQGTTEGWISGGMRVKVDLARDAAKSGIPEVHIVGPDDLPTCARSTRVTVYG